MHAPTRTIIWGMESTFTAPGLTRLELDGVLQIVAWFGERRRGPHVTDEVFDLQGSTRGIPATAQHLHFTQPYLRLLQADPRQFMEMTARSYQRSPLEFQEYQNILAITAKYFLNLLTSRKVELVIFGNIPHEGPDNVLYRLCQESGVRTLVFAQSLFPNKFFAMERLEDFGQIARTSEARAPHPVERKFDKDLFYMKVNRSRKEQLKAMLARVRVSPHLVRSCMHVLRLNATDASREMLLHQKWKSFAHQIANRPLPKALPENYVYFPLHLQPELTTSALGGIYCDQLLALELLASRLPTGWKIIVKENPKQGLYRRDVFFFQRLATIPDVVYLTEGSTYELMQRARLVATITGTAGWEAISGGKPALVFGQAWYRELPGIYTFSEDADLEAIANARFEHSTLERRLGALLGSCGPGVIDPAYAVLVTAFDPIANSRAVASFIRGRLHERTNTEFPQVAHPEALPTT